MSIFFQSAKVGSILINILCHFSFASKQKQVSYSLALNVTTFMCQNKCSRSVSISDLKTQYYTDFRMGTSQDYYYYTYNLGKNKER